FQAEDGIRGRTVTGVQTCALPIWPGPSEVVPGRLAGVYQELRAHGEATGYDLGRAGPVTVAKDVTATRDFVLKRNYASQQGGGEIGRAACRQRGGVEGGE